MTPELNLLSDEAREVFSQRSHADGFGLHSVLSRPSAWGEMLLRNRDGSRRAYRDYQAWDLDRRDKKLVHLDGRKVGKTVNVATLALWYTFLHAGKSMLVATPHEGHLKAIIGEVEFQLGQSEILRATVLRDHRGRERITHKPYFEIQFTNGATLHMRLAGPNGAPFRSLHVDYLIVDEAAWLTARAWTALRQCLNAEGTFRVYSTPSGIRHGTYYKLTQSKDWEVVRWPSWLSPDWTQERSQDLQEFYGGQGSPGWLREVAGEHGTPGYGAFNATQVMRAAVEDDDYILLRMHGDNFSDCREERQIRERLQSTLNLPGGHGTYWLGGDLGYTADPTELLLLEELEGGVLTLRVRVHAERVPYPVLAELIALLDRLYTPVGIGLDRGGNGLSVIQHLESLDKFKSDGFNGRLVGYDFGGSIALGEDSNGTPVKRRMKEHMTALINKAFNGQRLRLPAQDHEITDQLLTHSYTIGERGVLYTKGNDHIVDALRCAVLRQTAEGANPTGGVVESPCRLFLAFDIPRSGCKDTAPIRPAFRAKALAFIRERARGWSWRGTWKSRSRRSVCASWPGGSSAKPSTATGAEWPWTPWAMNARRAS